MSPDWVLKAVEAGVDVVSVSLNAHDEVTYKEVCSPKLENAFRKVLEFIRLLKASDVNVEITTVMIPEVNIPLFRRLATDLGAGFRVRPYLPCVS